MRSCPYKSRRTKSDRSALPISAASRLVNSVVISRVDYCNSLLYAVLANITDDLQSALNVAIRFIYNRKRLDHVRHFMLDDNDELDNLLSAVLRKKNIPRALHKQFVTVEKTGQTGVSLIVSWSISAMTSVNCWWLSCSKPWVRLSETRYHQTWYWLIELAV